MSANWSSFLSGMLATLHLVAAAYFLRFWRKTGDRFFSLFALSMAIMAVNRFVLVMLSDESEVRTMVYVSRLVSYLLILGAIFAKNLDRRSTK